MMDNCTISVKAFLDLQQIKFTEDFIEEQILSHPDHPSLLSISDTLEKYGVENLWADSLLQREQLKTVFGGYGDDGCPDGHARCSCSDSDGGVTVGCSSTGNCTNFCD